MKYTVTRKGKGFYRYQNYGGKVSYSTLNKLYIQSSAGTE